MDGGVHVAWREAQAIEDALTRDQTGGMTRVLTSLDRVGKRLIGRLQSE